MWRIRVVTSHRSILGVREDSAVMLAVGGNTSDNVPAIVTAADVRILRLEERCIIMHLVRPILGSNLGLAALRES
jgi:hypothetical protein